MEIVQSTYASIAKYQNRTAKAIFSKPTRPGSLLIAVDSTAGTVPSRVSTPSGFANIAVAGRGDLQLNGWYRQNAPSTTEIECTALDDNKSHQLRVFEIAGMAQSNALDRISIRSGTDRDPFTDSTGLTSQADELVMGFVVNQIHHTSQTGFKGGLTRLFESISPQTWSGGSNQDWERSRMSVHVAFQTSIQSWHLHCDLDCERNWIALIVTFRGGTIGPARMTATQRPPRVTTKGRGSLSVFGPYTSTGQTARCKVTTRARGSMSLFNYQYRYGGRTGFLMGSGTPFHVEGTEGLGGMDMRTSDDDQPRNDGSLRGIDLQQARQIIFTMNVGKGRVEVERNMQALYRAMAPRRDVDAEIWFRFPTLPVQMMRVRPISLPRLRNRDQLQFANQKLVLQAADPRHYTAVPTLIDIPNTPAGALQPLMTPVVNIGNASAYPIIRIQGPEYGPPVTRIRLVNETALVSFEAELTIPRGSILTGDMDALIRGLPVSPIELDRQGKYGAWQLPREPFRIDDDPTGFGGYNNIYLETIPVGAPVRCWLEYRDTWFG